MATKKSTAPKASKPVAKKGAAAKTAAPKKTTAKKSAVKAVLDAVPSLSPEVAAGIAYALSGLPVNGQKTKKVTTKSVAKKSTAGKNTYTLTLKGEEVEIFRREYKTQSELAECLHCARNWDHAGGDGVYGFVVNRSGVHLEVTDMKRKTVFKKDIKEEDLVDKGGELQIETKGSYFDESAKGTKGKKYYYDCITWYRDEYKAELELNAPFDPSKLSLTCRTYIGPDGKERKFIQFSTNCPGGEGLRYGGSNLTSADETVDCCGDDDIRVWTLVNGVREEQDIYPDEDEGEGW